MTIRLRPRILRQSHPWIRRAFRHDKRPASQRNRHFHQTPYNKHAAPILGHFPILLRHAGRLVPHDLCSSTLQSRAHPRRRSNPLVANLHVDRGRHYPSGSICPAILPGLRRKHHPNWLHVYRVWLLHAARTSSPTIVVVLLHGSLYHHRRRAELRLCANRLGELEEVAVYIHPSGLSDVLVWNMVFFYPE